MNKKLYKPLGTILIIIVFFAPNQIIAQSSITGFTSLDPGIGSTYTWIGGGFGIDPIWSSDGGTNVTFLGGTAGFSKVITIGKSTTMCVITLKVNYDYLEVDGTKTPKTTTYPVYVNPFLISPTMIYPGESNLVTNIDNCLGYAGHNTCLYDWNCNDLSAISCFIAGGCSNTTSNVISINCPTIIPPSVVTSGIYTIYCIKKCGLGFSYNYPSNMNIKVALHDPIISGNQGIGCGGAITTNIIFTASPVVGATYYVWSIPAGWSITNGATTNAITVSSNGLNGGNISVTAFAANGSPVHSNLVTYPITCCTTDLPITTIVNSGITHHQQAANTITASNTINNGGFASYHAGIEVKLIDGFSALQGSYLHAYIEGCTGTYNRIANLIDSTNNGNITHEINPEQISESNSINLKNQTNINDIKVYPNPNNGEFNLILSNKIELPNSIIISDILGNNIKTIFKPTDYKYNFNIKELNNGLYIINVYYNDKIMSKRIVKE
jgi:hypothetical protein